jgi:hypothetical protein
MNIEWNRNLQDAPYEVELLVKNELMDLPVLAFRGYHNTHCVSDPSLNLFQQILRGVSVCPTMWCVYDAEKHRDVELWGPID